MFGILLARFADAWVRRSLIVVGLFFWSLMTAMSGLASSFSALVGCRIGVGVGEASASLAAYAMIFKSRAMMCTMQAFPTLNCVTYGIGFWTAPLLIRLHDATATEVGVYIGLGSALGGLIGVTPGGYLADRFEG